MSTFTLSWISMAVSVASSVFTTKPSISVKDLVKRSEVVAVGNVIAAREISRSRQDGHGSWTPQVYKVHATIVAKLMGDIENSVEFEVEDLRFDPGKEFVLFLERRGGRLDYLKAPATIVEATPSAIDIVNSCIKRSAHKQLN